MILGIILEEKQRYQHRRHNKNLLLVHLIFATKYRKPILVYEPARRHEAIYIYETCCHYHLYIKAMETDNDHLHILLQYNPTDSISRIVSLLKQHSTHLVWASHESFLRRHYWKERTFWSDGYFAASIGEVSASTVEQYIANQGKKY